MIDTAFTAQQPRRLWPMFLTIFVGAMILAAAFILVTQRSSPLILTPGVIGLLASFVVSYAIWQGRVRNLLLCLVLAVLLTALTYGMYHLGNYVLFRRSQAASINIGQFRNQSEVDAVIDDKLRAATGSDGFIGYLKFTLNSGMIVRSGMMGPADQVTGSSLLFYWFIDVGFILLGSVMGAWLASRRSFCEHCDHYYGRIAVTTGDYGLVHLAWLTLHDGSKFNDFLNAGHFESAGALLKSDKPIAPLFDVLVERCFTCETHPVFVYVYQTGGRFSTKRVLRLRKPLEPQDFSRLLSFTTVSAPKPKLSTSDTGWLLSMIGVSVVLIVLLVGYSLI
jgi:Ca2+/Na+ antiporter